MGTSSRHLRTVWYAVIAAVAVLTVLFGIVIYAIREERASTACGFTPPGREEPPGSGSHADWECGRQVLCACTPITAAEWWVADGRNSVRVRLRPVLRESTDR
jgi:hypothetical protein